MFLPFMVTKMDSLSRCTRSHDGGVKFALTTFHVILFSVTATNDASFF